MIRFILNNSTIETDEPAGSTVLDFIRYKQRLTGTKIGCREGDCGACTVLAGGFEEGKLVYRSVTSCLMPLANAAGKHIVSVEGINMENLSPVQDAMVRENGTQCGFCTIGFVMSLTGFIINENNETQAEAIESIDGNICRCTGYKSIERAATSITSAIASKPSGQILSWLVDQKFLPQYFKGITNRLEKLNDQSIEFAGEMNIGGGTDLIVQKPLSVKRTAIKTVLKTDHLKGIATNGEKIIIGAAVTVSEFTESPVIQKHFPELSKIKKLISSTPIRNMATMGGNLVNASPIGDMSIFFLGLDASLEISSAASTRTVALKDFYRSYKQTDLREGELVSKIIFNASGDKYHFSFEKVSKRTHLDIASVNSAALIKKGGNGEIKELYLSAGGVAPFPKYLKDTASFLAGKKPEKEVIAEAISIMNSEIAPISDARGTAAYKRLLLRQLLIAHLLKCFGPVDGIKNYLLGNDS